MSDISLTGTILAIVVLRDAIDKVSGGGTPVFVAETKEEQEKVALIIGKILKGMVHDLENGIYFITRH